MRMTAVRIEQLDATETVDVAVTSGIPRTRLCQKGPFQGFGVDDLVHYDPLEGWLLDFNIFEHAPKIFPRRKNQQKAPSFRRKPCADGGPAFLPETKRVYVRTFGCSHNAAFMKEVRRGMKDGKAVVVSGCIPQGERGLVKKQGGRKPPELDGASSVGIKQIGRVNEAVAAALRGETFHALGSGPLPSLELPKVRANALVEIVPLSSGCLGACSYCKTRHARGALGSYALADIVARVDGALADGVGEVWLSSEDTGAYGIDLGTSVGALLEALLPVLEAHPHGMLRVGMTNPPYVLDQLEVLGRCLNHAQVYAFLHVPVQSGSDAVLAKDRMNREYTVADFRAVVDGLAARVDGGLSLMTDVICGFPGETDDDFDATYALVEDYAFGLINISQFYARPGTPAASMKRVHTATVKDRSRRLSALTQTFRPYDGLVGTVVACAAHAEVADGGARLVCHTKTYAKVLVPFDRSLVGARFEVRIGAAHRWHVDGVVLRVLREADAAGRPALRDALANLDGRLARDAPPKDATAAAPAPAPSSARRPGVASVLLAVLPALAAALWWSIF
ncbi:tRNA (N(6)-L-threonylcarbamoyladenosine(37)-C(2))-methylthiotransferase [Aureococcus anophagefferens]|nr:tRNA (N(6)-L-threonylcarbamoyladenosine(37)-C(2))-methylthiotransferase [Aureococcus anophagefferens]